jgi:LysR family transcriptional regulator, hydrogen peroxide-inducible genes activator
METQQVRYFVALCETLNFTRAAERANVTQPSLTRAIKLLEDELGGPLFHRERGNTHLTELGRLMRPYLDHVHSEIEAAKTRAREFRRLEQTSLNLGVMCTIGPTKLVPLIDSFQRRHPEVEVSLRDAKGRALEEMLLKGELEIALYGLPFALDERLHALPLFEEKFVITVGPGHRLVKQNAVRSADLHGERYLSRANCEFAETARAELVARDIKPNRIYASERDDWIQAMVLAGLGYGFTPECAVTLPGVVTRPLVDPEFSRTINLVSVRGRPHSPAVGAFVRQTVAWRAQGCPALDAGGPA